MGLHSFLGFAATDMELPYEPGVALCTQSSMQLVLTGALSMVQSLICRARVDKSTKEQMVALHENTKFECRLAYPLKMSGQIFQFQFDISKGITIPAQYLGLLLSICGEDDIQPIAIPPLELFGGWLMVDSRRIEDGVTALKHRRNAAWKPLLLISPPKATQLVRKNILLTSAFLFATCCSIIFSVKKTSAIIYEMMSIGGAVAKYNITSDVIFRFVEVFNGCRDSFVSCEKTPNDVYETLCEDTLRYMRIKNIWIRNLYEENDANFLAMLLYEVLDALSNMDNEIIELEGSKGGFWIAFAFMWLRPAETEVFVADVRVYPEKESQKEKLKSRLIIRFRDHGPETNAEADWLITKWKATAHVTEPIKIDSPTEHAGFNPLTSSPWKTARHQIELIKYSLPVVRAIGHLAGALVEVVTECGRLWNEDFSLDKRLCDICSPWYLKAYTTIMGRFGWVDLNNAHQENLASLIKAKVEKGSYKVYEDDTKTLGSLISSCFLEYEQVHREKMLIRPSDGDHEEDIIEYSIHLAAHAIISSVYRDLPQHATYWPLQPQLLRENSKLIREMLLNQHKTPQGKSWVGRGASFASLRRRAIQSAIPSAVEVGPADLAFAGDGYVAFSSALAYQEWTDNMADERIDREIDLTDEHLIGTIEVFPGCLQQKDLPGRYIKLSEDSKQMRIASRLVNQDIPMKLFSENGEFEGVVEKDAREQAIIEVKYFLRRDDSIRTLFLTTHLEILEEPNHPHYPPQLVPTSWHRSIDVNTFADHVTENTSRQKQLEKLARSWQARGITMRWCRVGAGLHTSGRYIATTAGKKECRFFEAGSVPEDARVFIRQGVIPLNHCVKVAMDVCEDDTNWVIIA